jgi:hypothetical protein
MALQRRMSVVASRADVVGRYRCEVVPGDVIVTVRRTRYAPVERADDYRGSCERGGSVRRQDRTARGRPCLAGGITRLERSADPDGLGEPCSGA